MCQQSTRVLRYSNEANSSMRSESEQHISETKREFWRWSRNVITVCIVNRNVRIRVGRSHGKFANEIRLSQTNSEEITTLQYGTRAQSTRCINVQHILTETFRMKFVICHIMHIAPFSCKSVTIKNGKHGHKACSNSKSAMVAKITKTTHASSVYNILPSTWISFLEKRDHCTVYRQWWNPAWSLYTGQVAVYATTSVQEQSGVPFCNLPSGYVDSVRHAYLGSSPRAMRIEVPSSAFSKRLLYQCAIYPHWSTENEICNL